MSQNKDRSLENAQGSEPGASTPAASQPEGEKEEVKKLFPQGDEIGLSKKKLLNEINRIDIWTSNLVDNGLFDNNKKSFKKKGIDDPDTLFEEIQGNLRKARTDIDESDLSESEYHTSKALRSYDKALYASSSIWRFSNVYAAHMWIYLIGFLLSVLAFYWIQLDTNILGLNPPGVRIQETALHATTWGTVGAILRGLWFLKDKVSDRKYRNSFRIYLLSTPFLGGLFGAILYFMIVAGLFIIAPAQAPAILSNQTLSESNSTSSTTQGESATQANGGTPLGNVSTLAIIPLAALAGFNWEWAIMILKRIGDSFKGDMESEEKIEK